MTQPPTKPKKTRYLQAPAKPPTQAGIEREDYAGEPFAVVTKKAISGLKGPGPERAMGRAASRLYESYLATEMQVAAPSHLVLCKDWAVAAASADRLMAAAVEAGLTTPDGLALAREARQWGQRAERVLTTLKALDAHAADRRRSKVIDVGKTLEERFGK